MKKGFLPKPVGHPAPSLHDLLGDLTDSNFEYGSETTSYPNQISNDVQKWFRTNNEGLVYKQGDSLTEHEYSKHSTKVIEKFEYMLSNNGSIPEHLKTKKFAQRVMPRVWGDSGPNITATSLPDDYVHFAQARVPTVREWARIQTFPDWYQFAGPRTTGGRRRAGDPNAGLWDREVPKYTQIGNAVPVLLANKVAQHLKQFLVAR